MSARTMGDVARDLRAAAQTARQAVVAGYLLPRVNDDAVAELAQAALLLTRAATRFDTYCGLSSEPGDVR